MSFLMIYLEGRHSKMSVKRGAEVSLTVNLAETRVLTKNET